MEKWQKEVYTETYMFIQENRLFDYPINLKKICKSYGWKIKYYTNQQKDLLKISKDAFVVTKDNENYTIFLNKDAIETRQRFSLAHEIGHILLEHHKQKGVNLVAQSKTQTIVEKQADMFARLILCPSQITNHLPKNSQTIATLLNVSNQMAQTTLKYINQDLDGMDGFDYSYKKTTIKLLKQIGRI